MTRLLNDSLDPVRQGAGSLFGRLAGLEKAAVERIHHDGRRQPVVEGGQHLAENGRERRTYIIYARVAKFMSIASGSDTTGAL